MKGECLEVAVIDFPNDTVQLSSVVAKAYDDYFFTLEVTNEDTNKTAMYRSEAKRKAEVHSSFERFISLDIADLIDFGFKQR